MGVALTLYSYQTLILLNNFGESVSQRVNLFSKTPKLGADIKFSKEFCYHKSRPYSHESFKKTSNF